MTRYIFVSGGVVSSVGKGITVASLGRLLKSRGVSVYSFYAPSAGLTSWNGRAVSFGQSALNRVSDETGGRAFFQGTDFVTFNAYFSRLAKTLNEQGVGAY